MLQSGNVKSRQHPEAPMIEAIVVTVAAARVEHGLPHSGRAFLFHDCFPIPERAAQRCREADIVKREEIYGELRLALGGMHSMSLVEQKNNHRG